MTADDMLAPICRQVWDRSVEGRDVSDDPKLTAHVGSCVTCFRTLAEMRDVPRLAAAAAAALVLVSGRAPVGARGVGARTVATTTAGPDDEVSSDDAVDVADLDESALRRLLDRLRVRAPGKVAALAVAVDARDAADAAFDDDGQMNEELAELDGPALLRIERSLGGPAL